MHKSFLVDYTETGGGLADSLVSTILISLDCGVGLKVINLTD